MNNLIKSCIRYRSITLFTLLLVLLMGIFSYTQLPQNEDPPIVPGFMMVYTYWPGASPRDVETYLSKPLEQAISKHSSIYKMKSESLPGLSIFTIRLSDNYQGDAVNMAYQQIRNYINDAKTELPQDVIGPYVYDRMAETEAYVLGLTSLSGNRSNRELQALLENIRDELKTVDGVGECRFYGEQPERIFIDLSTDDLAVQGLHPGQIMEGIKSQNFQMAEPYLNLAGKQLSLEVTGAYKSIEQIRDTIIYADPAGHAYRVRDLNGKVFLGYDDPPQKLTRINGEKSLILTVSMKRGFHIVKWGKKIDKKLAEIRAQLPADVKLLTIFNQAKEVQRSVNVFMENFFEAILLVILILGLGLGFRNSGIVAVTIPLIVLGVFAFMYIGKIELHQMSISALIIALGILVDNSVVVIDNIERYLRQGLSREQAALKGVVEVAPALFAGTAAIFCAFFCLIFLPGSAGEYIRALPQVICASLVISFLVALLATPTLASLLSKAHQNHDAPADASPKSSRLREIYYKFVDLTQNHKSYALGLFALVFALALFLAAAFIPQSFFPAAEKSQFLVNITLPDGWNLYATQDKVEQLEKQLESMKQEKFRGKPLVRDYVSYIGQNGARFFISIFPKAPQARIAQIMVTTPGGAQTNRAARELREFIAGHMAGGLFNVVQLETGPIVDYPVEVRVTGSDPQTLKEISREIEKLLISTRGIVTISNDYGTDSQKIVVKVDQDKAKALGLSSRDIAASLYTGFQGYPVSFLKAPERKIDIVLRLEKSKRRNIDDLKGFLFTSGVDLSKRRLDEFAEVYLDNYSSAIVRREERRTLSVGAFVAGRLPNEILREVKPKLARMKLPNGYFISYGGQNEEADNTMSKLLPCILLGLVLMFLIITYKFKSFKIALAIYMSLPSALIGAILGMLLMRQSFGFMSAIGLSSLGGIVIYNAIVLVEFIHNNLKSNPNVLEAIKEGGYLRIRPIVMTACCAIGGLLPLALSHNPLFEPLCWVIIFGLLFSTVTTLLMTPVFYVAFGGAGSSLRNIAYEKPEEPPAS